MLYDEFIKIPKYFLIPSGFWPFKLTNNALYALIYKLYYRFQTVSYTFFILSLLINCCILVIRHDQPTRLFSSVSVFIIVLETCVKILLFQFKKIPNMFAYVMKNEEVIWKSRDLEVKECYKRKINYCRRVNISQFLATLFSCSSFTLVHVMQVYASKDLSEFKDTPFMHDMWYPFKRENHMPLVIFINIFLVNQGLFFNTFTQTTFICLMIYASARLKILQIRLRKFDQIAKDENRGDVLLTVKELIAEHQHLIGFVQSLNERTNYVMLMEFILNSVSLASGTIQLVVIEDVSQLLSSFSIVVLVILQIFTLAWCANEISEESLKVADAISASKWNEQSEEVKKLLILMIMRAQKPLGLTAGPFFQMTTKTALMTLKIAYSYLSLMMQNYED